MENVSYLPLGSIVIVKGGVRKLMIIARGLGTKLDGKNQFFDYGACLYPEGLVGDNIMFFNHADIVKEVFVGFADEENELMVQNINDWIKNSELERGNAYEINQRKAEQKEG